MNGKIYFTDIKELAEFMREFTGSTACFQVNKVQGMYILEFNGGY